MRQHDRDAAAGWIRALTGDATTPVTWQLFGDASRRRGIILHGALDDVWDELVALNEAGYGVFATVNETDGRGRKASNIVALRALFVDDDKGTLDLTGLPEPTVIVESSPGRRHAYWRLEPGEALERFQGAQEALIERLGTDPKVKDLSRVMRVPGFWHLKREPFCVRLIESNTTTYTIDLVAGIGVGIPDVQGGQPEKYTQTPDMVIYHGHPDHIRRIALRQAKSHAAWSMASISGHGGWGRLYSVACRLVNEYRLDDQTAYTVLQTDFNPRCSPPWVERDLRRTVASARAKEADHVPGHGIRYTTDVRYVVQPLLADVVSRLDALLPQGATPDQRAAVVDIVFDATNRWNGEKATHWRAVIDNAVNRVWATRKERGAVRGLTDPWCPQVRAWLETHDRTEVRPEEIFAELGIAAPTDYERKRLAGILTGLGLTKKRVRAGGGMRGTVYRTLTVAEAKSLPRRGPRRRPQAMDALAYLAQVQDDEKKAA